MKKIQRGIVYPVSTPTRSIIEIQILMEMCDIYHLNYMNFPSENKWYSLWEGTHIERERISDFKEAIILVWSGKAGRIKSLNPLVNP